MWIKPTAYPASGDLSIFFDKVDSVGGVWKGLYLNLQADGRLRMVSGATTSQWLYSNASTGIAALNEWTHIAVTIDKNNCIMYINGHESARVASVPGYTLTTSRDVLIGAYKNTGYEYDGAMDDVRLYNYALSPAEILDTYALVGHWPLNETAGLVATNNINSNDNGMLNNGPNWVPAAGRNGALNFAGAGSFSHVRVQDSASFNLTDELTLSTWINATSYADAGKIKIFLSKTDYANAAWHGFYLDLQPDGKLRLVSNATYTEAGAAQWLYTQEPIPLNEWLHVALTINQEMVTFYINGVQSNATPSPSNYVINNNIDLMIGAYQNPGYDPDGMLDEVRFYNKSLDATEIAALYNLELSAGIDTDGDGITDYQEQCFDWDCNTYNPYHPITNVTGTDLDKAINDTDGDGYLDGDELAAGSNSLDASSIPNLPNGDVNGDGQVDVADMLHALRILTGQSTPTINQQKRWDMAPQIGGVPAPDGENTLGDYLMLSRKVLGLDSF